MSAFEDSFADSWSALTDTFGESVTWARVTAAGAAVTGFPKAVTIVFRLDNKGRFPFEDGAGDKSMAVVQVSEDDLGSEPQIGLDSFTLNATVWTFARVREKSGGVWECEFERVDRARVGGRTRIER